MFSVWYVDLEDRIPVALLGGLKLREAVDLADKARKYFDPSIYVFVQQ